VTASLVGGGTAGHAGPVVPPQTRYVRSGTSYISQSDMRQHFGLGSATTVEIDVLWPDGTHTTRTAVKADQVVRVDQ